MQKYLFILITFFSWGTGCAQPAVNFSSSNLPILIIDTNGQNIVDDPKISAHLSIIDNGPGNRNQLTDPYNGFDGNIGIEIRGSSSQSFPKKQYGIEVRDANGNGIDQSLLGMPKKDDWVLYAAYDDKSLLRDALAYHLGRLQGRYAPRFRYVEVVINGNYQGVYLLLEKIKRDKNRVNIAKMTSGSTSGNSLTGGYIIKVDKTTGSGGDGWTSSFKPTGGSGWQNIFFQYDYPKAKDIVAEQKNYIQQYVNTFESALYGPQFQDPLTGYANFADRDSFIDYFIMNEVTKNPDGYRLSTFFYKQADVDGGKIFMGPIWDYNEGFGNVDYCTQGTTSGFVIDFNTICPDDYWQIPFWWKKLLMDSTFRRHLSSRWQSLRAGSFSTGKVLGYIDSVSTVLNLEAQQRNFQRWPILGTYVWPNYYVGPTYASEISWLKNWITERLAWLDTHLIMLVTAVEKKAELPLRIYPNPFHEALYLEYPPDVSGLVQIEVYDLLGKKITETEVLSSAADQLTSIPASGLSSGIYLLKATQANRQTIQRIVKK